MSKYKLSKDHGPDTVNMRDVYCDCLIEMARTDPNIVVLEADLMGSIGTKKFQKEFPERTVDCGIQEADMIGIACGMSVRGKIPFAHTFAPFCTRRACDQIFISGSYNKANVKIIGSDPGITAAYNGGTHMPFEDMGIMRGIPEMTVIEPTDTVMLKNLMPQIAYTYGMFYIRMIRKSVNKVFAEGAEFTIGKAAQLTYGGDVAIFTSGYCVVDALKAAETLKEKGIHARVINMFTWKPADEKEILRAALECGAIVTVENHNVINGLGSTVAEVLVKHRPVPMEMVGVQDQFGEVGPVGYLRERYQLTDQDIVKAVQKVLRRK